MKNLKKVLAVLLTVCLVVGMMPFSVLATNEFGLSGGIAESGNLVADPKEGGNREIFNLSWDSIEEEGDVTFDIPGAPEFQYDDDGKIMVEYAWHTAVQVYRDGVFIGHAPSALAQASGTTTAYIGELMDEEGTYVFVAYLHDGPPTANPISDAVVSEPYEYTMNSVIPEFSLPTNLRFEKEDDRVYAVWDAPEGWVEGRDTFDFTLRHEDGGAREASYYGYPSTRYDITDAFTDVEIYVANYYTRPVSLHGNYYIEVRALSGNPMVIRTGEDFAISTAMYEYPSGNIIDGGVVETEPTETPTPSATVSALSTPSKVLVDGTDTAFDAYNIDGNNYFKLRDLANVVSGTEKQFEVTWDAEMNAINLISGEMYTAVGGEMATASGMTKEGTLSTSAVYVDGIETEFTAYNIDGNNYFKLRDVAKVFDIGITWDGETSTIGIDTAISYVE